MKFLTSKARQLNELSDFYLQCGYGGTFNDADDLFYVRKGHRLLGVVRISQEDGVFVLRGMQVLPWFRGKHIGRKLLSYMEEKISLFNTPCYCLAHRHLTQFYTEVGFTHTQQTDVPEFLITRKLNYQAQGLNINLLIRLPAL